MHRTDWFSHYCYAWRNTNDSQEFIKGYDLGAEVKFKAGYKIWATAAGGDSVSSAVMSNWVTYVVQEKADSTEEFATTMAAGAMGLLAAVSVAF